MLYQIFDVITIIISLYYAISNIKRFRNSSLYIIYYFFFFIYVVPLILDYTYGFPQYYFKWDSVNSSYGKYAGFINSYQDDATRIGYDIFIIFTQAILLSFKSRVKIRKDSRESKKDLNVSQGVFLVLFVFSIIPIIASLAAGYYYIPFLYGWRENPILSMVQQENYYSTIERCTYIGVTSSLICLMLPRKNILFKLLMLGICFMNISIESKRSIVFFTMAVYLLLKYEGFGRKLNFVQFGLIAACGILVMVIYSIYIKSFMRGYSDPDILYTNVRIDMFRDDTARLIIYSFLSDMKSVVEWPLQSYFTEIAFIFPLDILNGLLRLEIPSIGFNTYLTSALVNAPISAGERWMTTSMVDETLANFSVLAFLIVPFVLGGLAKLIDKTKPFIRVLMLSALLLSLMYSFNYIIYYLEFVLLFNVLLGSRKYEKKRNI